MKFNCQLNMVTFSNCVKVTSFLVNLSVYIQIFYWIFRIMTEFSQLPNKGLVCQRETGLAKPIKLE